MCAGAATVGVGDVQRQRADGRNRQHWRCVRNRDIDYRRIRQVNAFAAQYVNAIPIKQLYIVEIERGFPGFACRDNTARSIVP